MNTAVINKYDVEQEGQPRYFRFEADFVEDNVRCIPMIVRFKLDACGVKLKLAQWSRFSRQERARLSEQPCSTETAIETYRLFLQRLIAMRTGQEATLLEIEDSPAWADEDAILPELQEQAQQAGTEIGLEQWKNLYALQRFALIKLCRPGHENKNFPHALKEFGL